MTNREYLNTLDNAQLVEWIFNHFIINDYLKNIYKDNYFGLNTWLNATHQLGDK